MLSLCVRACLGSEQPTQCWRETLYLLDSTVLAIFLLKSEGDFSVNTRDSALMSSVVVGRCDARLCTGQINKYARLAAICLNVVSGRRAK